MSTQKKTKITQPKPTNPTPTITKDQLERVSKLLMDGPAIPLLNKGTTTQCPICDQDSMYTTNNLVFRTPTPIGVVVVTRLPGAQCPTCGAVEFDSSAARIIQEEVRQHTIHGDYVTKVSTSGGVPAILVKEDLRRVLKLEGKERMSWKIIDGQHAYVEIQRDA